MNDDPATVTLSLISHTNAGKTTLARTLLGRDVGEVRDAAHVTLEATAHTMQDTAAGDRLRLFDTPGFGDSARLAKRLAQQGNPIGWFLSEVWDRFRDRPFWLAQHAVRNVRDEADVVLYLVNASEDPADAGYVAPELAVLAWIGKPVVVLLNQTGRPRPRADEAAEEERWRESLAAHPLIRTVLTLDAFARCWVQEIALLHALRPLVPEGKARAFERLADAWQARRMGQYEAAIDALAEPIARAACDKVALAQSGLRDTLRGLGKAIGLARDSDDGAQERAMRSLAERLDRDLRQGTDRLIAIHGLEGRAAGEVLARLAQGATRGEHVNEGKAAMLGGFLSGALSGLAADLASGGITLGAGMLAGGLLGAFGGGALARGYNVARGTTEPEVRWSDTFLHGLADAALLRYLAVAHFGRGRGEWVETEYPPFWREVVGKALAPRRSAFEAAWGERGNGDPQRITPAVRQALRDAADDVLAALYPDATPMIGIRTPARS